MRGARFYFTLIANKPQGKSRSLLSSDGIVFICRLEARRKLVRSTARLGR